MHIPGGYYHVIGRGLERRRIFADDADKDNFLARLGEKLPRLEMHCLAWAVMPNHYHLLIRVGEQPLSTLMASVLGGYAGHYNRRHMRHGYVFQNRYSSILCDENTYLLELIRYIHLNPLRAGITGTIDDLACYPWTGHAGISENRPRPWHAAEDLLALFGKERRRALGRYKAFLAEGAKVKPSPAQYSRGGLIRSHGGWEMLSRLRKEHRCCIGDERILGDSHFVEKALKQDRMNIDARSRLQREGWDLERLVSRACQYCGIEEHRILEKSRCGPPSMAKALICYLGTQQLGLTSRAIADRLRISQPAVSKWTRKGRQYYVLANDVFSKQGH